MYPKNYPTSVIVGCVDIVDVITNDQFQKFTENDMYMRNESIEAFRMSKSAKIISTIFTWNNEDERRWYTLDTYLEKWKTQCFNNLYHVVSI